MELPQPVLNYSATNGTLIFGTGVLRQTFTVPILSGIPGEEDKTVHLNLFHAQGGHIPGHTK